MGRRVFISVAEVSGDKHAAQLIRELRQIDPQVVIEGVGGPQMQAAGAVLHRNTVIKAAMGWRGILRAGEMMRLLRWTRHHFDAHRPDLWIGVDSPSMNFHFARAAHERGIPTLQYVAPQLWAWAVWRMKKLRRWVDQVACILPFEEAWFKGHGVNATFVGHPLFDELAPRKIIPPQERFPNRPPVIGLLAGSRKSEAQGNFPGMLAAAALIQQRFPGASYKIPTTPATDPVVRQCLAATPHALPMIRHEVGLDRFDEMVPACDLCLTVSGTATLHVACYNVPMVVVYQIGAIAWNAAGRWLVPTRTFALVNVLATRSLQPITEAGGHIVPELVPWSGGGESLAACALQFLENPLRLEAQREALAKLVATIDRPGASRNVADLALGMMESGGFHRER